MIACDHKFVVLEARLALAEGFEHRPVQPAKKSRLTPYSLIHGASAGTRRVPASSHPAQRDTAKAISPVSFIAKPQVGSSRLEASPLLARSDRKSLRPWRTSSKNLLWSVSI